MAHVTLTVNPGQSLDDASLETHLKMPAYPILRRLVGGYIETVPHLTACAYKGKRIRLIAFADEEGQLKNLPRNDTMSDIWKSELLRKNPKGSFWYEPQLFGPVVLVINAKQLA